MKKIYLSLLSLCGVLSVNAQLTQANHAPASGDTYQMYRCDSSSAITPGASGANAMWNYSTISIFTNKLRSYTVQAAADPNYPQASLALASAATDMSYLASTTTTLGYYGGNVTVSGGAGTITYTAPAILAAYPMTMGTTSAVAIGGSLSVSNPFPIPGTFSGNSSVTVDGTGTISLPGGYVYPNTMRVVTSQTINIVAAINGTLVQVNYEYYAPGIKAPVFTINTMTANVGSSSTNTYVTINKNLTSPQTTVSIAENSYENSYYNAFPNPSSSVITIVTNQPDAKMVAIYDITGKLVDKLNLNEGKVKLDVSSYNNGLYLYTVSSENKALKTAKFTVSR